jgi:integrase/recombinase XerD
MMDLLGDYEMWMRSWGASTTTIRARIKVMSRRLAEWGDPANVTTLAMSNWLASSGFAPWTRITYYNHLKSFFGWLAETGVIAVDPTVALRTPRQPKDLPRPLTCDEVAQVLAEATGDLRTWLLLGLLAGLRAHEIAKVRGEDVDERSIFVVGKGGQQAFIPTHPDLWVLAQSYPRQGWWFPAGGVSGLPHVQPATVTARATRLFRQLGIEGSSHRARHTYATQLLRNGANIRVVQTLMRHESLATTARYTAVDEAERALAIAGLSAA